MKIVEPSATLLWATPVPVAIIEQIGRVCYKSEDCITEESAVAFVRMLLTRKHEAMIEHASASIHFVTDRGISHEIVRHRLASYAQESTRYCNYSKEKFGREITVVRPSSVEGDSSRKAAWERACTDAEAAYFRLLDAGVTAQIARSVLPTCLKTEIVMTTNLREWRHFLGLRLAKDAHPDMRRIARLAQQILRGLAPVVFDQFDEVAE
jgi:thymidylate synthase (FAD)